MSGETIDIPTPDGVADAYLARPDGDAGDSPAVLLLIDAFGLRPQIERMADRIAGRGFVVLAPNTLYRGGRAPLFDLDGIGDPARRDEIFDTVRPLMAQLTPDRVVPDGAAYLDALERVGRGPVAITGYCMGGRAGWEIAAAHSGRVAALGAFHTGGLVTDDPSSPHTRAGSVEAEVFFGHADNDQSMTPENIATLEAALDEAGVRYRSELFADAPHGYTMADTGAYREEAAERHFDELFALLDRTIATRATQ